MKDKILSELHDICGLCRHCGKRKCEGRKSNSYLPEVIYIDDVIAAIDRASDAGMAKEKA